MCVVDTSEEKPVNPVCQACFREIEDEETWHYVWKPRPGKLEPVHDKCAPDPTAKE
jgi:hypothetical protein